MGNFTGDLDVNDNFGVSVTAIGDLDGNGVTDMAVGAFNDDDGGSNIGAVWILFMDVNNEVISHTKISDTSGNFNGDLDTSDRFGVSVAYLGDMNNDGLIELGVGATYDGDGGFWHGAIWILSLNSDGTVNSHAKISDTQGGFTGFINGDAVFGADLENIGDLNNDGIDDLAVGSRRDADGGSRRGAVWILFMNPDFTVNSHQKISDTQGNFTATLEFEDFFGGSVVNIGDLDQDGVTDLVVGSYRDDDQITNSGSFYVLFLNADGTVKNYQKVSNLEGGFDGSITTDALFGRSIDGVIDIDNDGKIEVVVGALQQQNPTSLQQTGAFYIIELNADGTVSEQHFYTQGENCFTGELDDGDYFGGSVGILNDSGIYRLAIGAYRDSENGNNKGAVWILELGEQSFTIVNSQDPTDCATNNGEITIGNLESNTMYDIMYEVNGNAASTTVTSDVNGEFVLSGLAGGNYTNIFITNTVTSCSGTTPDVILNTGSLTINFTQQSPSLCGASDGSITLSDLIPNSAYQISYTFNSNPVTLNINANNAGEIILANLLGGTYNSFTVVDLNSNCEDILGDIFLNEAVFQLNFTASMPSSCNASDGSILISDLTPNQVYIVDYFYQSNQVQDTYTANTDGEILLTGLNAGLYEFIMVVDTVGPCTDGIGEILLENSEFTVNSSFMNPSACGLSDGSITFENANVSTAYIVSYILNGATTTVNVNSDASGTIILGNLGAGLYESIVVEEVTTNCIANVANITLENASFTVTASFTNPSACGLSDGSITFENVNASTAYSVSYILNGTTTTINVNSDASGTITLGNLGAGLYESIVVEEVATNCIANVANITLENASFTVTASFTNPSACGLTDGSITFENVNASTAYIVSYILNGTTTTINVNSDASGTITLGNLGAGLYESIVVEEVATNCIANVANITLENSTFDIAFSFENPTDCDVTGGSITFVDVNPNAPYAVTYTLNNISTTVMANSDASGTFAIEGLGVGLYESISIEDLTTNCVAMIPNLFSGIATFTITPTIIHPTDCESNDGSILFQGAQPNTDYTLSFIFNNELTMLNITSNNQGEIRVENLGFGVYNDVIITEAGTDCSTSFSMIQLNCEERIEACFRVRRFFTPNADNFNDVWQLEDVQDCNYRVYIYDRYGKIITILTPNFPTWDGTYNGNKLPSSDYWISIEYTYNGQQLTYTTHITLKR